MLSIPPPADRRKWQSYDRTHQPGPQPERDLTVYHNNALHMRIKLAILRQMAPPAEAVDLIELLDESFAEQPGPEAEDDRQRLRIYLERAWPGYQEEINQISSKVKRSIAAEFCRSHGISMDGRRIRV